MTTLRTSLVLLALVTMLSACDSAGPEPIAEEPTPAAQVTVGATYDASVLALHDAATDAVVYDYLDDGAVLSIEFVSDERFEAAYVISEESLRASGETDDVEGGINVAVTGTYLVSDGALTFDLDTVGERFVFDGRWTVDSDGTTLRRRYSGSDLYFDLVLTRG